MKFCVMCNLHFGVSGGFFQGAKLRTLVYAINFQGEIVKSLDVEQVNNELDFKNIF